MKYGDDRDYYIAFNCLIDFTYQRYRCLLKSFASLAEAFFSGPTALMRAGWKPDLVFSFIKKRSSFKIAEVLIGLEQEDIKVCCWIDDNYPFLLRNIYDPPPLFYYRGNLALAWQQSLSVVGSRQASYYGQKAVQSFLPPLIKQGIVIVSGLAIGIDSIAHETALNNGGQTAAVLGSGLDASNFYPKVNRFLAQRIVDKGGLLISEFPLGTPPVGYNFPRRNRIIAGLSPATFVAEAGEKSGSLITAKQALEEGREVLSIPADIFSDSYQGNNRLIKDGARVVETFDDILTLYQ